MLSNKLFSHIWKLKKVDLNLRVVMNEAWKTGGRGDKRLNNNHENKVSSGVLLHSGVTTVHNHVFYTV